MARLLDENLDEYTRVAVPLILAVFPDWEQNATVRPVEDGSGGTVGFNVPCPNPNVEMGLFVGTECKELTVGFDMDHRHYTDYETPCNAELIADGIKYAKEYLEDRRVTVSWYDGERWCGSSSVEAPGAGYIGQWSQTANRFRFRSWTGKYDREVIV
jgi:hypothetical protein